MRQAMVTVREAGVGLPTVSGIEQVNVTISQMEAVTQRNAGLVEENNTLTETLLAQSRELVAAAEQFKLDAAADAPAAMRAEPRAYLEDPVTTSREPLLRIGAAH